MLRDKGDYDTLKAFNLWTLATLAQNPAHLQLIDYKYLSGLARNPHPSSYWRRGLDAQPLKSSPGATFSFSTAFSSPLWRILFDRTLCLLYTLCFVRGISPSNEPSRFLGMVVGREFFSPGTSSMEWDRRAAGMGRQPRKAE